MLMPAQRQLKGLGCLLLPAQGLSAEDLTACICLPKDCAGDLAACFYLLKGCTEDLPVCLCLHKDCPDNLAACFGL